MKVQIKACYAPLPLSVSVRRCVFEFRHASYHHMEKRPCRCVRNCSNGYAYGSMVKLFKSALLYLPQPAAAYMLMLPMLSSHFESNSTSQVGPTPPFTTHMLPTSADITTCISGHHPTTSTSLHEVQLVHHHRLPCRFPIP